MSLCDTCKFWGPNDVGDTSPHHLMGNQPCHNKIIRAEYIVAYNNELPGYIRVNIVRSFDVPYCFGCILHKPVIERTK